MTADFDQQGRPLEVKDVEIVKYHCFSIVQDRLKLRGQE